MVAGIGHERHQSRGGLVAAGRWLPDLTGNNEAMRSEDIEAHPTTDAATEGGEEDGLSIFGDWFVMRPGRHDPAYFFVQPGRRKGCTRIRF